MNKETFKKYGWFIGGALAIIIVIVVVVLIINQKSQSLKNTASSDDTVATSPVTQSSAVTPPALGIVPTTPKGGIVTVTSPQLHFVSQIVAATTDASATKHGLFTIEFTINAADKPLYLSQSCNPTLSTNGVSFSLVKDGVVTTDGIGSGSCMVNSISGASLSTPGRFLINAYTPATFRVTVAAHPSVNGSYKIRINQVGYALSDISGNHILDMDSPTRDQMQTNTVSL